MKINLNNQDYELQANGRFMLDYQHYFKSNVIQDMYQATNEYDMLKMAQLVYISSGLKDISFEEWLSSFDSPFFLLPYMADLTVFFLNRMKPTVDSKSKGKSVKKKK